MALDIKSRVRARPVVTNDHVEYSLAALGGPACARGQRDSHMSAGVLVGERVIVVLGHCAYVVQDRGDIEELVIDVLEAPTTANASAQNQDRIECAVMAADWYWGRQRQGADCSSGVWPRKVSDAHTPMLACCPVVTSLLLLETERTDMNGPQADPLTGERRPR